jgi:branched-chain amino acid transport system permease protein
MRGRPLLFTSYESDQAILNTTTKRVFALFLIAFLLAVPLFGEDNLDVPLFGFLGENDWVKLLSQVAIFAIAALGLNILTGLAGQVSLGHAFFMGLGAYTAAWLGAPEGPLVGLGLPLWLWLPMAGVVPAVVGVLVGPTAVRVRGLYLGIVTLALVFIGEYFFRNLDWITGGSQAGRSFPDLQLRLWKEEEPLLDLTADSTLLGFQVSEEAKVYLFLLVLALVAIVIAKNIQRTRIGRAFMAIRDRDIAAEIMGVDEFRYKLLAFGLSSFFAGVAGALLAVFVGRAIPERWGLDLSVQVIAIVLIGGAGTVSGTLMGSAFVVLLPKIVRDFTEWLAGVVESGEGVIATLADPFVAVDATDFGLVNVFPGTGPGLSVALLNQVLYGLLIIGFLIFEPLGLYGIWLRIRNYWKGWPFTY